MGQKEKVIKANTHWICASCLTCTIRCPREIDVAALMEAVREYILREEPEKMKIADIPKDVGPETHLNAKAEELELGLLNKLYGHPEIKVKEGESVISAMKKWMKTKAGKSAIIRQWISTHPPYIEEIKASTKAADIRDVLLKMVM